MGNRQTQEQKRAAQAWQDVHNYIQKGKSLKEYKALASSAPADIQINGLGQVLAFWRSKGKPEHEALYDHLSSWVIQRMGARGDLLQWIMQTDSVNYRKATVEALAYIAWLKRFAQAEIES